MCGREPHGATLRLIPDNGEGKQMNRRFVALSAGLTALGVAALSQLPAGAAPSSTQAAAVKRPPITASAPCSGNATIAVRLADNPKAHRPDRLRVSLAGGQTASGLGPPGRGLLGRQRLSVIWDAAH